MATTLTSFFLLAFRSCLQPSSPHSGAIVEEMAVDAHRGNGTGANKADQTYAVSLTVDSTGTNVNLRSLTDALGTALAPAEVVDFGWQADRDNTAAVNITATETSGGAADPWLAFLVASGDGVKLPPGCTLAFAGGPDGSLPLTASSRGLKFAAASGSQVIRLLFTFRSV